MHCRTSRGSGVALKCQGWEGERNRVYIITLRGGFHHRLEFCIGGSEKYSISFLGEEIRTQSSAFEKKEMGMYTIRKQSYWFLSCDIFNDFFMRLTKIWGIMQIESFVKKRWRPRWITVPPDQRRFLGEGQRELLTPNKKTHRPKYFYRIRHSYTKTAILRSCRLASYQSFWHCRYTINDDRITDFNDCILLAPRYEWIYLTIPK